MALINTMLDRFSQNPFGPWVKPVEEQNLCEWCTRPAAPGKRLCRQCEEEDQILSMPFGEFWTCLRDNMEGSDMDVIYTPGMLEFRIDFDSELTAKRVSKLLKLREIKHIHKDMSLTFWIGGNLDFVYQSLITP